MMHSVTGSRSIETTCNSDRNMNFSLKRFEEFKRVFTNHLLIDPHMSGNDIDTDKLQVRGHGKRDQEH